MWREVDEEEMVEALLGLSLALLAAMGYGLLVLRGRRAGQVTA